MHTCVNGHVVMPTQTKENPTCQTARCNKPLGKYSCKICSVILTAGNSKIKHCGSCNFCHPESWINKCETCKFHFAAGEREHDAATCLISQGDTDEAKWRLYSPFEAKPSHTSLMYGAYVTGSVYGGAVQDELVSKTVGNKFVDGAFNPIQE